MRPLPIHQEGQLLLPMIAALFLFCVFWLLFVGWIRSVYWRMRMDVAADLTALSAARQEATQLNAIAATQTAENAFMQKAKIMSTDVAHMQVSMMGGFMETNQLLKTLANKSTFSAEVFTVAQTVAQANGANLPAVPLSSSGMPIAAIDPELDPQGVLVIFFYGYIPVGGDYFEGAYYTRRWSPTKTKAQPDHQANWRVCHGSACGSGKARLWLDVPSDNELDNGGFPSPDASLLRSLGIQCFFPQFNARLVAKR